MNRIYFTATKLGGYIFSYIPAETRESNKSTKECKYFSPDIRICGICGEAGKYPARSGVKDHMLKKHPEWVDTYIILGEYPKVDSHKLDEQQQKRLAKETEKREKYEMCLTVDKLRDQDLQDLKLQSLHGKKSEQLTIKTEQTERRERHEKRERDKKRVYLKPWEDPNSMFCSTEFLEKLLNKKIATGKECKDKK
jgi:hypothetical protein